MDIVWLYLSKKYIMFIHYFYWTLAVIYTRRNQFVIPLTRTFCGNLVTTKANLNLKSSPRTTSNARQLRTRRIAIFKTNTDKTLGKLSWISKISLQRNGMAVIPKITSLMLFVEKSFFLKSKELSKTTFLWQCRMHNKCLIFS